MHPLDRRREGRIDPGRLVRITAGFDKGADGVRRLGLAQQDAVHPQPRIWRNCQALKRTLAASVPLTGASTMTVGVRCPERVGPPSTRPRRYSASPAISNAPCSMPMLM